jgi:glycosyltransferase involved in cell wall biosynthesis
LTRIVAVTRILNEDDIVEAFVRHHAAHVDHMLFLDNGSCDRTLEILKALQDEGFRLTVFQSASASFDQIGANIWAYQMASQILGAEWVVFLDADEFIATPHAVPLVTQLPEGQVAACLPLVNYGQTPEDDEREPVVPWRMRWRFAAQNEVGKVMLRGGLPGVVMEAGNHGVYQAGAKLAAPRLEGVFLAHYPRRNGWQVLQKIAAGRLKALAAGKQGEEHSRHYASPFETLRDKPWELFEGRYLACDLERRDGVEAPLAYLGGSLQYWQPSRPEMKALQGFLQFAERLARAHGRLADEAPQAKGLVETWNAKREFLF